MSIEKIIEGVDTVSVALDKYNNMCDELITNIYTNGDEFFMQKFNKDYIKTTISFDYNIDIGTVDDLKTAIINNQLIAGYNYVFTHNTIFTIPNTSETITGDTETLIGKAISSNKISTEVSSLTYPNEIITYNFTNKRILTRFDYVKNLKAPFDYRVIKFRRWKLQTTGYTEWTSSTLYNQGVVVKYDNEIYYNNIQHTSTNVFDYYKWCKIPTDKYLGDNNSNFYYLSYNFPINASQFQDYFVFNFNSINCNNIIINCPPDSSIFNIPNIVIDGFNSRNIFITDDSDYITIKDSYNIFIEKGCQYIYCENLKNNNINLSSYLILINAFNDLSNNLIYNSSNLYVNECNYLNIINSTYLLFEKSSYDIIINSDKINNTYNPLYFISDKGYNNVTNSEFIYLNNSYKNIILPDCDNLTLDTVNSCYIKQGVYNTTLLQSTNLEIGQNSGNNYLYLTNSKLSGSNSFLTINNGFLTDNVNLGLGVSNLTMTGNTSIYNDLNIIIPYQDSVIRNISSNVNKTINKTYLIPNSYNEVDDFLWTLNIDDLGNITYPLINLE